MGNNYIKELNLCVTNVFHSISPCFFRDEVPYTSASEVGLSTVCTYLAERRLQGQTTLNLYLSTVRREHWLYYNL